MSACTCVSVCVSACACRRVHVCLRVLVHVCACVARLMVGVGGMLQPCPRQWRYA